MIELGIVQTKLGTKCEKRGEETWKLEERENYCNWRCRKCRKTHSVDGDDLGLFSVKLLLRSLMGSLSIFCAPLSLSPDKSGMVLGIDHRSTRTLFDNFREFLAPIVEKLSNTLKIGGLGQDVELDEISFRSTTGGNRVVWIRYLASVRRGSIKVWISQLPYRITEGGQGGGGPIGLEELKAATLPEDNPPRLAEGSICHTDGARTYKQLGSMDSPLLESDVFHSVFFPPCVWLTRL